jgi:hypothetical protein
MKSSIIVLLLLLAGRATAQETAALDSTRADSNTGLADLGYAPLSQGLLLSKYVSRYRDHAPAPALLTISLNPFAPRGYVPPTRFDAMLFGAGTAGTLALFAGAIGNTLGAFDEDTTWIMTGAAAAAGALYSGSRFKVRLGPDDSPRPPADR